MRNKKCIFHDSTSSHIYKRQNAVIISLFLIFSLSAMGCKEEREILMNEIDKPSSEVARYLAARELQVPQTYFIVSEVSSPFVKHNNVFKVASQEIPPRILTIAVDSKKRAFSLYSVGSFEALMQGESLTIDSEEEAIDYASFYLKMTQQNSDHINILKNIDDIPGVTVEQKKLYEKEIEAPRATAVQNSFIVKMVTWSFGELQREIFTINKEGEITEKKELIASPIGTSITLE